MLVHLAHTPRELLNSYRRRSARMISCTRYHVKYQCFGVKKSGEFFRKEKMCGARRVVWLYSKTQTDTATVLDRRTLYVPHPTSHTRFPSLHPPAIASAIIAWPHGKDRGERLRKREDERVAKRAKKRRRLGKKPLTRDTSGGHEGRVTKHTNKRRLEV